jgi:hypothetical protein
MKMKNVFPRRVMCLSIFLMMATVSCATPTPTPEPALAGGYFAVDVNQEIKAAALFAVQTQTKRENKALELTEISRPQQQVVAGMNYQFELSVKTDGKIMKAKAVVFKSLQNRYELSLWQWLP